MSTHHTTKVIHISLTRLQKIEVSTLYNEVIDIIKNIDTKALHIDTTCDVLLGMEEKAKLLSSINWVSEATIITDKLAKIRQERFKFAALITNHMRSLEKAGFNGTEDYINYAKLKVNHYLLNLRKNNQTMTTKIVGMFLKELDTDPRLNDALDKLGFEPYLKELETIQDNFLKTYAKRREMLSKRHKGSTQPIQREILNVLSILFKQVDYYQHAYKDIDYSGLVSSLNNLIASNNKAIKTRHTKNTNKKLKKIEKEQAALEEQIRIESDNQKQEVVDKETSAIEATRSAKGKQDKNISRAQKKQKGKVKPISGLLNIKRKTNNEENDDEDDET